MLSDTDSQIINLMARALEPAVVEAVERVAREVLIERAPSSRLLTVNQVAEYLAVSPSTVRRLEQSGKLQSVRISGAVRFKLDDVAALVAG